MRDARQCSWLGFRFTGGIPLAVSALCAGGWIASDYRGLPPIRASPGRSSRQLQGAALLEADARSDVTVVSPLGAPPESGDCQVPRGSAGGSTSTLRTRPPAAARG